MPNRAIAVERRRSSSSSPPKTNSRYTPDTRRRDGWGDFCGHCDRKQANSLTIGGFAQAICFAHGFCGIGDVPAVCYGRHVTGFDQQDANVNKDQRHFDEHCQHAIVGTAERAMSEKGAFTMQPVVGTD